LPFIKTADLNSVIVNTYNIERVKCIVPIDLQAHLWVLKFLLTMLQKKLMVFAILLSLCASVRSQNLDIDIAKDINPRHPTSGYWRFTTNSAYFISAGIPVGLLVKGIVTKDKQLKKESLEAFGAIVIELLVSEPMKFSFNRLRPGEKYPAEIFPYHVLHGKSFPSGHSSLAFSAAASLSIQCKKWYITLPAYAWAASVGYSRVYLGEHYPSDVVAGAAVGIGSAYLAHWLNKVLFPEKRRQ
jgi:membrane-associated phospholipid phosphatase